MTAPDGDRSSLQADLASRVRAKMAAAGYNQADLAFAANLSQKHLSQMLTGKTDGTLTMWQHLLDTLPAPAGDTTPCVEDVRAALRGDS